MTGQQLVTQYLNSKHQSASSMHGKVSVSIQKSYRRLLPDVTVNWPGCGDQDAFAALAFASDLATASALALAATKIIADWDCDQWVEK